MPANIADIAEPVDRTARVNAANQRLVQIMDQNRDYTFLELYSKLVEADVTNRLTGIVHTFLYVSGLNIAMREIDRETYVYVQHRGGRYRLCVRRFDQDEF